MIPIRIAGPKGSRIVSPTMLAMLAAHLAGPCQVQVRGNPGRTLRAIHHLGLVYFDGAYRPRVTMITHKGLTVIKAANSNEAGQ